MKSIASKVMWMGRATVFLVGLAVVLALVLGMASAALGATGGNFILGKINAATKVSKLTANIAAPALSLVNTSTGAAATALNLTVASGKPPLQVNATAGKATNLNSDKLDGKDSADFAPVSGFDAERVIEVAGPLPKEGTFASQGGKLVLSISGSGFRGTGNAKSPGKIGMKVKVDGNDALDVTAFTNEMDSHKAFVSDYHVIDGLPAGQHTIRLEPLYDTFYCNGPYEYTGDYCTSTDSNDPFHVTVMELPTS